MSQSTLFRYHAIDNKGVIAGARAHFRQGRSNAEIYTDEHLRVKGKNPWQSKADGRFNIYLPVNERYEVTIRRADGTFVDQFIHTALPEGGTERIIEQPAPEPEIITKEVDRPETLQRITNLERAIQDEREKRKAAESRLAEKSYEEGETPEQPPEAIADLFDPSLTARQNQEALQKRYAALMSERELHLGGGDTSKAMELLKRAERIESGITWNRARLAEVL